MTTPGEQLGVFVTVGTDHHPFNRVIRWTEAWLDSLGDDGTSCFLQIGTSQPPHRASWARYLPYAEVEEAMRNAMAVVCHGGPATIMDCRRLGTLPIVVPRQRALGEHVDDHQVAFTLKMAQLGQVRLAGSELELRSLLSLAISEPETFRLEGDKGDVADTVARFEELVSALFDKPAVRDVSPAKRRGKGGFFAFL